MAERPQRPVVANDAADAPGSESGAAYLADKLADGRRTSRRASNDAGLDRLPFRQSARFYAGCNTDACGSDCGQNYSEDPTTGLRWLDPSFTAGFSFSQASVIEGWQHATQQQLAALFASDTVQSLMDTLGGPKVQNASFYALIGIYDAPALDNVACSQ